jgi:hypothetical protein
VLDVGYLAQPSKITGRRRYSTTIVWVQNYCTESTIRSQGPAQDFIIIVDQVSSFEFFPCQSHAGLANVQEPVCFRPRYLVQCGRYVTSEATGLKSESVESRREYSDLFITLLFSSFMTKAWFFLGLFSLADLPCLRAGPEVLLQIHYYLTGVIEWK